MLTLANKRTVGVVLGKRMQYIAPTQLKVACNV